jgi:hypothetical protein
MVLKSKKPISIYLSGSLAFTWITVYGLCFYIYYIFIVFYGVNLKYIVSIYVDDCVMVFSIDVIEFYGVVLMYMLAFTWVGGVGYVNILNFEGNIKSCKVFRKCFIIILLNIYM